MGEIANKLKEKGIGGDMIKAAEFAEDLYSKVSWVYAAYSAGKSILTDLGFLDGPNNPLEEINKMLQEISHKLDQVLVELEETKMAVIDGSKLITRTLIANEVINAKSAAYNAKAYIENSQDEQIKTDFDDARTESQDAANRIHGNEYYWMRIYLEDALYSDSWSAKSLYPDEVGPDGTKDNYIWDYRIALFAYLNIISFRSIVYLAASKAYQNAHLFEMQGYATQLNEVYKRILNSFAPIRPPNIEEFKYIIATLDEDHFMYYRQENAFRGEKFGDDYDFIDPVDGQHVKKKLLDDFSIDYLLEKNIIPGGQWHRRKTGYILGMVEKYTGYSCRTAYPSSELEHGASLLTIEFNSYDSDYNNFYKLWWAGWKENVKIKDSKKFQNFYDRFLVKHQLRTWRQGKQLYHELGLPKIKQTIRHLYQMFGLGRPKDLKDYTAWSFREVYSIMPFSLTSAPTAGEPISLRKTAYMIYPGFGTLVHSKIISLRQILLLEEDILPV